MTAAALVLVLGGGVPAGAAPAVSLSPTSGPPGTTITVTGTGFPPGAAVELHWDGRDGELVGSALGPDFTADITVPGGARPNSYQVVAVVREGSSTSTSGTSFEVTGSDPVDPGPTTTTTVEAPVDTRPPATTPTTAPAASPSSGLDGGSRTGGIDGGLADTTNGSESGLAGLGGTGGGATTGAGTGAGGTGAGQGAGAGATTPTAPGTGGPADASGTTAVPGAPGGPGVPGVPAGDVGAGTGSAAPQDGGGPARSREAADAALPRQPASQSSGVVDNPVLLVLGLGMVFGAGVVLAIRNRHKAGAEK